MTQGHFLTGKAPWRSPPLPSLACARLGKHLRMKLCQMNTALQTPRRPRTPAAVHADIRRSSEQLQMHVQLHILYLEPWASGSLGGGGFAFPNCQPWPRPHSARYRCSGVECLLLPAPCQGGEAGVSAHLPSPPRGGWGGDRASSEGEGLEVGLGGLPPPSLPSPTAHG